MRSRRRLVTATSAEGAAEPVTFRDFELYDDKTGVSARVCASDLQAVYQEIAATAGVPASALLANSSITAKTQLTCHLVPREPRHKSWNIDSEGYVMLHLKQSSTVRGHSFLGSERRGDDDFVPPPRLSRLLPGASQPATPPQRRGRAPNVRFSYSEASPGSSPESSPSCAAAGATQPLMIRLHRAAFLASCNDPQAYSGLEVRHICGNKACAVVSHFRAGDSNENAMDRSHHKRHRGSSYEAFAPPQQ